MWERDKAIVRQRNFEKMRAAREKQLERQKEINETRLNNLAKARKVKARKRNV
jgi:hypothetical protein